MKQIRVIVMLAATVAATVFFAAGPALADQPVSQDPATNVWIHGGSNLGECSVYLAQLDVPGVTNVRASVNHVIQEYGPELGLSSPGALYSVRAHQDVNLAPADECLPRQLPGGQTG